MGEAWLHERRNPLTGEWIDTPNPLGIVSGIDKMTLGGGIDPSLVSDRSTPGTGSVGVFRVSATGPDSEGGMHVEVSAFTDTREQAKVIAQAFPKSYQVKATGVSGVSDPAQHRGEGVHTGMVVVSANLRSTGVTGAKNEAGAKRLERFAAKAQEMGFGFTHGSSFSNSTPADHPALQPFTPFHFDPDQERRTLAAKIANARDLGWSPHAKPGNLLTEGTRDRYRANLAEYEAKYGAFPYPKAPDDQATSGLPTPIETTDANRTEDVAGPASSLAVGIREAIVERPERIHHGSTATNAFFVADDGTIAPLNELPRGAAGILVHSHSPYAPEDKQTVNYGDLYAWFHTMRNFNTSQGTAVIFDDGTMDVVTLTDHTDPKVLKWGQKRLQNVLGSTYGEASASGLRVDEFDRRKLRAFCEEHGLAYHEQVRWTDTPPKVVDHAAVIETTDAARIGGFSVPEPRPDMPTRAKFKAKRARAREATPLRPRSYAEDVAAREAQKTRLNPLGVVSSVDKQTLPGGGPKEIRVDRGSFGLESGLDHPPLRSGESEVSRWEGNGNTLVYTDRGVLWRRWRGEDAFTRYQPTMTPEQVDHTVNAANLQGEGLERVGGIETRDQAILGLPDPNPLGVEAGTDAEQPFDSRSVKAGDLVIDHTGKRWSVYGTARYAGGSGGTGRRTRGISVRPAEGGRARVMAEDRFRGMVPVDATPGVEEAVGVPDAEGYTVTQQADGKWAAEGPGGFAGNQATEADARAWVARAKAKAAQPKREPLKWSKVRAGRYEAGGYVIEYDDEPNVSVFSEAEAARHRAKHFEGMFVGSGAREWVVSGPGAADRRFDTLREAKEWVERSRG